MKSRSISCAGSFEMVVVLMVRSFHLVTVLSHTPTSWLGNWHKSATAGLDAQSLDLDVPATRTCSVQEAPTLLNHTVTVGPY